MQKNHCIHSSEEEEAEKAENAQEKSDEEVGEESRDVSNSEESESHSKEEEEVAPPPPTNVTISSRSNRLIKAPTKTADSVFEGRSFNKSDDPVSKRMKTTHKLMQKKNPSKFFPKT